LGPCPGRSAAPSDALQSRAYLVCARGRVDPGSAQQRFTLQRVRDTRAGQRKRPANLPHYPAWFFCCL